MWHAISRIVHIKHCIWSVVHCIIVCTVGVNMLLSLHVKSYCVRACSLVLCPLRVNKVDVELITVTDGATKQQGELPYGMCVWATGVAPLPVTKTFMQRLGYAKEG